MTTQEAEQLLLYEPGEVKTAAVGRWQEIAHAVGIGDEYLTGDHGPCPKCRGTDRWRVFEDFEDTGGAICNQCGQNLGDGFALVKWFLGCDFTAAVTRVAEHLGLPATRPRIVATYDYTDEAGELLFQVCRYEPGMNGERKTFRQRRPDGNGGWTWKTKGMRRVPYRLPELLAEPGRSVVVCEGEKDVDNLRALGLLATCNAGGAGKWKSEHAACLAGRNVVIIPDHDDVGRDHADQVAASLQGVAASVRVVELPVGKDASDWIAAGGTREQFVALAKIAAEWQPTAKPTRKSAPTTSHQDNGQTRPANDIPVIALGLDEGKVARQTLAVLATVGWDHDKNVWLRLYQRGGQLVHVTAAVDAILCGVELPQNMLRIRPLPAAILRERIASAVRLYAGDGKDGEPVYVRPPAWLVKAIHERGQYPRAIRPLTAIVRCPTLRPDGTVLQRRGYDDRTGLLYVPDGDYPPIPDEPTRDDAAHAANTLLDVVADFPFQGPEHRSVWLAMVLTLVGRSAIRGPCPMFAIDANCPGTGKSLLTDVAGLIAYGDRLPRKPWPGDDDNEVRKTITSVALEGLSSVLWDNVGDTLGSSSLDAALTGTAWTDRILGTNTTTGTLPLLTVWTATGNNLVLGKDTPRRVLYSRLETDLAQPEERRDFQHDNLVGWVRQRRHLLATHAVTILRAFAHAGFPDQDLPTWGSFEAWSDLIRHAIVWTGLPDPWETRTIVRQADRDMELLGLIHAGIDEANQGGDGVTSAEIVQFVSTPVEAGHDDRFPHLRAAITEICGTRIDGRKVGNHLRHFVGRVKAGRRLIRRTAHGGGARWIIERVRPGECV